MGGVSQPQPVRGSQLSCIAVQSRVGFQSLALGCPSLHPEETTSRGAVHRTTSMFGEHLDDHSSAFLI